jgi:hypothetical protein
MDKTTQVWIGKWWGSRGCITSAEKGEKSSSKFDRFFYVFFPLKHFFFFFFIGLSLVIKEAKCLLKILYPHQEISEENSMIYEELTRKKLISRFFKINSDSTSEFLFKF